jgi:hypothetical protein
MVGVVVASFAPNEASTKIPKNTPIHERFQAKALETPYE